MGEVVRGRGKRTLEAVFRPSARVRNYATVGSGSGCLTRFFRPLIFSNKAAI
jgi:hypothetical protein